MSDEPAALPSLTLSSSVLRASGCGVTGDRALPLACHLPRPSMESRGGGGEIVGLRFSLNNVSQANSFASFWPFDRKA